MAAIIDPFVSPFVSVLHGPNLNLLGTRSPEIYGSETLADLNRSLEAEAQRLGLSIETVQLNGEGAMVDHIQGLVGRCDALILNAAAYTHTSVAIRDAVEAIQASVITIEVHLSLPENRERFRQRSFLTGVVAGRISGFGKLSYVLALEAATRLVAARGHVRDE
jgi:3-dehydroquinate dehydratase II